MKTNLQKSFFIALFSCSSLVTFAATETITFKVNGTSVCESQIENLISILDGVTSVDWDASSKNITIVFDNGTIEKDRFYVALAEGGFDNQELQAKKSNYEKLSTPCRYIREEEKTDFFM